MAVRIGCRVCALAGVFALLMAAGGATRAGASGLTIGAGSTVKLGDALLALGCNDLRIPPGGTLLAQSSTIRLGGDFDNQGTFDPGTGMVVFEEGCNVPTNTPTATSTGTPTATPTNTPLRENGRPCTTPGQCQSMHCVDAVCCETACTEADHICSLPGREGTCLAITAAPAPALSGIGTMLGFAVLLLVAGARLALRRGGRKSGVGR